MDWMETRLGLSQGHLSHIIAGRRRLKPEVAERLAEVLGLPLDYVLHGPAVTPAPPPAEVNA